MEAHMPNSLDSDGSAEKIPILNLESRALFLAYRKRGYSKHLLEEHFHKASLFNQDDLLDIKNQGNNRQTSVCNNLLILTSWGLSESICQYYVLVGHLPGSSLKYPYVSLDARKI